MDTRGPKPSNTIRHCHLIPYTNRFDLMRCNVTAGLQLRNFIALYTGQALYEALIIENGGGLLDCGLS